MISAAERRQRILEVLSDRRHETIATLITEFRVSSSTLKRDVEILSCSAPIFTVRGNGGGIYVAEDWYIGRRYLNSKQEALLIELLEYLESDKQKVLQSILTAFAMPRHKR